MRKLVLRTTFCFSILFLFSLSLRAAETFSYADLVSRLTDMERLARLPELGEVSGQATSYDRASKYDEATGKYVAWDANGDNNGCIEKYEDESILMAEIEGPGFLNHIWSAAPGKGHVKIYLDGSETPAVDLPFADYFNGKAAPFNRKALCYKTSANGENNWVPIPFKKSCRIVGEKDWGAYYYFQYTRLPEGTGVPTFSMNLDEEANAALDKANLVLAKGTPFESPLVNSIEIPRLESGGRHEIFFNEPAAFTEMRVRMELPEDDVKSRDLLRGVTISIYWDENDEPAVWAPLGDFFGVVTNRASCLGYPNGFDEQGFFYNRWFMPFEKAKIVIHNENEEEVSLTVEIQDEGLIRDISKYGRFHAKWHRNAFLPDVEADPQRWIDWNILHTEGRGKYVGVSLHIENFRGSWWGEGDEKFFIDGEKFPSYFGTGSEDYFGYAWSSANRFVQAFHSQPTNDDNRYYIVNNRWHITDAVTFQKSFDGYIEKYYKDDRPCLYAATAFWYMELGGVDSYKPLPLSERTGYYIDNTVYHTMPEGGIGDRNLMPRERPENLGGQGMGGFAGGEWEDDHQLWWRPGKVGETVKLRLPAPADGKFKLSVRMTTARDYGIHQFAVNGKDVGKPIDLYTLEVQPTELLELGVVELKKGDNEMSLTVAGKNEKSSGYLAGIDYVVLTPAE